MNKADLIKNSSWGIVSHIAQTLLLTLFFVILARHYPTDEFAKYVIATVLAQMLSAFSALGLGQWFVREVASTHDRNDLLLKFLRTQVLSGLVFYSVNIAIAVVIYDDSSIRLIASVFGVNIIFDNIINALKCLNIADLQQRKTFAILTLEAFLKCAVAGLLLLSSFSIVTLSLMLLAVRVVTLNLFLRLGTSSTVTIKALLARHHGSFADIRRLVLSNWPWIVIGGCSVVNWRIANIIISKQLGLADTAVYEISYRLFSTAQLLPVIVGTAVFPMLVRLYNTADIDRLRSVYRQAYFYYLLFGLLAYTFIYSFSDALIPLAFGSQYAGASASARHMFLTIIVFPTAFLQANVLCAMKLERRDMWFNMILLALNVGMSLVGLHYFASLTVINIALFISFVIFHLLQDALLIRQGLSSVSQVATVHLATAAFVLTYTMLAGTFSSYLVFPLFWAGVLAMLLSMKWNDPGMRLTLARAGALIRP